MSEFKSAGSVRNEDGRWNPYLVGAGLGVLSWLVFAVVNTPLGISTPISSAASLCAIPALVGFAGMLAGAVFYALSYPWVEKHIQPVAALGKVRLPEITGIPDLGWFVILLAIAGAVFWLLERRTKPCGGSCPDN